MKRILLSSFITALSTVALVTSAHTQSFEDAARVAEQQQACKNYVTRSMAERDRVNPNAINSNDIQVALGRVDRNGTAIVNWRIQNRRVSGYCTVNRNGRVINYQQTNSSGGNFYSDVERNWGGEVRAFRARVEGNASLELMSRPTRGRDKGNEVGKVQGGELVTVRRLYRGDNDFTWALVTGSNGQEGWINSRRLQQEQGTASQVEYNWGREVRSYRARVEEGGRLELLNRPSKGRNAGKQIASVTGGERVTVRRTYKDNEGNNWSLIRGSNGQEGWINSRRLNRD
ncbi:GW dipeptide domain-containing protein [Pantanalinema rosaneae CENA516]|uniref:GW dipeptide domain-containing protein n=1 Tax=Pantanalinema rosaneae TaxID=1620701 RepID=UPI003D6DF639